MKANKPLWTCTNEEGQKFFYYKELGWVNADTGRCGEYDLSLSPEPTCPADATHILVDPWRQHAITFVKRDFVSDRYAVWRTDKGEWEMIGELSRLSGYLTLLSWQRA